MLSLKTKYEVEYKVGERTSRDLYGKCAYTRILKLKVISKQRNKNKNNNNKKQGLNLRITQNKKGIFSLF